MEKPGTPKGRTSPPARRQKKSEPAGKEEAGSQEAREEEAGEEKDYYAAVN
jgi:hypothetical protein